MNFDENTRKLTSESGYIHRLDDTLYTDHAIYLGKLDSPDNYEEGNKEDYDKWVEEHYPPIPPETEEETSEE